MRILLSGGNTINKSSWTKFRIFNFNGKFPSWIVCHYEMKAALSYEPFYGMKIQNIDLCSPAGSKNWTDRSKIFTSIQHFVSLLLIDFIIRR